jgi:hypothetical protein
VDGATESAEASAAMGPPIGTPDGKSNVQVVAAFNPEAAASTALDALSR